MIPKIFPRNLTARASVRVVGNPDTTRLESGVGNCFPGLEFDHRNLDRRFFPGLIFEFASHDNDTTQRGARLLTVDLNDPDLGSLPGLRSELAGDTGRLLQDGTWFLSSITQKRTTIILARSDDNFDGVTVWRIVRCLEPGDVGIELKRRTGGAAPDRPVSVKLRGRRRNFVDLQTGVISSAYAAGELTQSLCSPWMHDFRDCACFYWASNHPDIVLAEAPPGQQTVPSGAPDDPVLALTPIDWLRSDRSSTAPAMPTEEQNRPGQIDHYEINTRWKDLSIVLRGREVSNIFQPEHTEQAEPLANPEELAAKLFELAKLEHAVALEYLYARYSLLHPDQVGDPGLKDDLTFVRHEMLMIAVSEMRHLRWANQLLWSLEHDGLVRKNLGPSLGITRQIPSLSPARTPGAKTSATPVRPRRLRPLTSDVLEGFIAVEEPSGFLDGQYARVLSTLRQPLYRPTLEQLAERIIADGSEHFSRFREIKVVLRNRKETTYLRPNFVPAASSNTQANRAKQIYGQITRELRLAYARGDMEDAAHIAKARALMFELDAAAESLARDNKGVPFFGTTVAAGARS